ncbi:MAG: hypothetical protein BGO39_03370 [Chloroflexi bacterium 54-19]|nr:MAG: hypothetical protein BGO39_03370 [Chloroflexi bacterium 54-19]
MENQSPKNNETKKGLTGNFKKAFGSTGAILGNVASQARETVESAADSASRKASLLFAEKSRRGQLDDKNVDELVTAFHEWLTLRKKVTIKKGEFSDSEGSYYISIKEQGLLGQSYLFIFTAEPSEVITRQVASLLWQGQKFNGVAILAKSWPLGRLNLEKNLGILIWENGIRLGKNSGATDYLSSWLVDYTGYQFEEKALIEKEVSQLSSNMTRSNKFFIGRDDALTLIDRSIVNYSEKHNYEIKPWIFSIFGEGGIGKSYFLQHIKEIYVPYILFAHIDHQDPEESEEGLISLIKNLASKLAEQGCDITHFEKVFTQHLLSNNSTQQPAGEKAVSGNLEDVLKVGKVLGGTDTKRILNQVTKKGSFIRIVPSFFNVAGVMADVGFGIYDRISEAQQKKEAAILSSQTIAELTEALIEDLASFVKDQQKQYLFWRRPVLAFDSYELIGSTADKWLRNLFLKSKKLQELLPVVIISGRYELMRFDSRWAEFQAELRTIELAPFSQNEADNYLSKFGITDQARSKTLYDLTGGHPLFLTLSANLGTEETIIQVLTDRILEEVEPEWHELFIEMAVPEAGFNLDTVEKIVDKSIDARKAFKELSKVSFVTGKSGLISYLPSVRKVLLKYGDQVSPDRIDGIREKLK